MYYSKDLFDKWSAISEEKKIILFRKTEKVFIFSGQNKFESRVLF